MLAKNCVKKNKALYIDIFLSGPYPERKKSAIRMRLEQASNYTPDFIKAALTGLNHIHGGKEVRKGGVTLHEFSPDNAGNPSSLVQIKTKLKNKA